MEEFNRLKELHPDWSDEQIWTAVSLNMNADKVIDAAGEDIDPNDPDVIETIIRGAMEWLDAVLPAIFEKVRNFFNNILSNFGQWVKKGLQYLFDIISESYYYY